MARYNIDGKIVEANNLKEAKEASKPKKVVKKKKEK